MSSNKQLYDEVVTITEDFLGPAAKRFIDRQIESHLDKSPENLTTADLEKLIDWSSIAIAHLTDNASLVRQFTGNLQKLMQQEQLA
jgi:hypothetical protein